MRTDTNGQRILLSVTRPLALSGGVTRPKFRLLAQSDQNLFFWGGGVLGLGLKLIVNNEGADQP